jgi:hypothetical protein
MAAERAAARRVHALDWEPKSVPSLWRRQKVLPSAGEPPGHPQTDARKAPGRKMRDTVPRALPVPHEPDADVHVPYAKRYERNYNEGEIATWLMLRPEFLEPIGTECATVEAERPRHGPEPSYDTLEFEAGLFFQSSAASAPGRRLARSWPATPAGAPARRCISTSLARSAARTNSRRWPACRRAPRCAAIASASRGSAGLSCTARTSTACASSTPWTQSCASACASSASTEPPSQAR